jgi:hypothetical protein
MFLIAALLVLWLIGGFVALSLLEASPYDIFEESPRAVLWIAFPFFLVVLAYGRYWAKEEGAPTFLNLFKYAFGFISEDELDKSASE